MARAAILSGLFGSSCAAGVILGNETTGFALDFAADSAVVRGPGMNYVGTATGLITNVSASDKWALNASGVLTKFTAGTQLPLVYDVSGNAAGIWQEEARTNLCLQSNDLTNASWTKTTMTTAKTATGPDGIANSATLCTATGANSTVLQAITSGSAARITSVYLRRNTGSGNIDLTQDNGTSWVTQSVTSTWTRFRTTSTTATNPTVGIRIVTSGDAVEVAYFQHELGAFSTTPIPTTTTSVTRNIDNYQLPFTKIPYDLAQGTWYCQILNTEFGQGKGGTCWGFAFNTNDASFSDGQIDIRMGATINKDAFHSFSTSGLQTFAGSYTNGVSHNLAYNGIFNGTTVGNDALTLSGTNMWIGRNAATNNSINIPIKKLMWTNRRLSDGEVQAKSAT